MPWGGGGRPKLGKSGRLNSLGYTSILPATMAMAAVQLEFGSMLGFGFT